MRATSSLGKVWIINNIFIQKDHEMKVCNVFAWGTVPQYTSKPSCLVAFEKLWLLITGNVIYGETEHIQSHRDGTVSLTDKCSEEGLSGYDKVTDNL